MSISLPNNKEEKRQRLLMLHRQRSITAPEMRIAYKQYCQLYDIESYKERVKK